MATCNSNTQLKDIVVSENPKMTVHIYHHYLSPEEEIFDATVWYKSELIFATVPYKSEKDVIRDICSFLGSENETFNNAYKKLKHIYFS